MHPFTVVAQHPRQAALATGGALALLAAGAYLLLRRRPTAEELEARRRERLASQGRIIDGSLVDARPGFVEPQSIVYRYRVSGVTYECNQDVSGLTAQLVLPALDLPIQVRYDRNNPGDSVVITESWNGLWLLNSVAIAAAGKSENNSNNADLH